MSIKKVEAFVADCDRCGKDYEDGDYSLFTDKQTIYDGMDNWYIPEENSDKCYCPSCFTNPDDDVYVIKPPITH